MSWNGFGGLNLSGVEAENGRSTLKPGSYTCKIVEAEVKATKDKTGHGLVVVLEAESGEGKVDDFINLHNRNADAERIGKSRLKSLLVNSGHPNPDHPGDVKSLIGRRVGVHVEQGPDWTDKNGQTRPGGGQPRRSGAYYKVEAQTGYASNPSAGSTSGGYNDDLNDDIPF